MTEHDERPPLTLRRALLGIGFNLLVLVELVVALQLASQAGDDFAGRFMALFFAALLPTVGGYLWLKRRWRD